LQEAVSEGRADFGISVPPSAGSGLDFEPLLTDVFVLVCAREDPLAQLSEVSWSVFSSRPFVATSPNSSIRSITDVVFAQAKMAVEPLYECNISTAAALVAAGLGVSAVPRLALDLVDQRKLAVRELTSPTVSRQLGIVSRPNRSQLSAANELPRRLKRQTHREAPQ
jgi:LysR family carnitine catabolism transcriptional activator